MTDLHAEDRLRAALRDRADAVELAPALDGILHRAHEVAPRRSPWLTWTPALAAAAAVALIVGIVVQGLGRDNNASPATEGQWTATVYYLTGAQEWENGETRTPAKWVAPEWVETENTGDAGLDAVRALLSTRPSDPDYMNGYDFATIESEPITDVHSVTHEEGVVTVDLTEDVWDPIPSAGCICPSGEIITQQLVWTVQEALDTTDPVRVLVDGEPARGIWLERLDGPVKRDREALSPVLITSPTDGETISGPVTVSGSYSSDSWFNVIGHELVTDWGEGTVVSPAPASDERGPFTYPQTLPPGEYTIRVVERSPDGGRVYADDTKRFTVEADDASVPDTERVGLYVIDNFRLVRQEVEIATSGNPGLDAVRALQSNWTWGGELSNAWYWGAPGRGLRTIDIPAVSSVQHSGGLVRVDFTSTPPPTCDAIYINVIVDFCDYGDQDVQQLVWTVTDALGTNDPVLITARGRPVRNLLGSNLDGPVERDSSLLFDADR